MLGHLHAKIVDALKPTQAATLSTAGPAAVQADVFPCEVVDTRLYLLVPRTSDHLFNLEREPVVVVTNRHWQVRGVAHVMAPGEIPTSLELRHHPEAAWCEVIQVQPQRVQLRQATGWGYRETIDVDEM